MDMKRTMQAGHHGSHQAAPGRPLGRLACALLAALKSGDMAACDLAGIVGTPTARVVGQMSRLVEARRVRIVELRRFAHARRPLAVYGLTCTDNHLQTASKLLTMRTNNATASADISKQGKTR